MLSHHTISDKIRSIATTLGRGFLLSVQNLSVNSRVFYLPQPSPSTSTLSFVPVIVMQQDNQYLIDILHAAQRILEYTTDTSLHSFYEDVQLQDKVVRRLLTIGKTAQRVSAATRQEMTVIAWSKTEKIKERLLQDAPVIDADQVWSIVQSEMPTLINAISTIVTPASSEELLYA